MKKAILVLSLVFLSCSITSQIKASSDLNKSLEMAKKYETNFYNHYLNGTWYVFSDDGVDLGDVIGLNIPSNVRIKYYVNEKDGTVIQYYDSGFSMAYVVWKNGTVMDMGRKR